MQILNEEQVGIEMLYRNKSIQDVPFLEDVVKRYSIEQCMNHAYFQNNFGNNFQKKEKCSIMKFIKDLFIKFSF